MSQALITHLLGTVAKDTELTEAERAHVSAAHVLCVLGVVNDHLARIGEANFEVCLRQAQALIERERVGGTKVAGLAKLSALLLPLTPLKATLKN